MDDLILRECSKDPIYLCKQGEFGRKVKYDFSSWVEQFGDGSVGWTIRRSVDTSAYLLPCENDGTVSSITLTETESQYAGVGALEVFFVNTGATQKRISKHFVFKVEATMQDISDAPPAWQSYVDAVHADKEAIENMSATAEIDQNVGVPSVDVEKTLIDDHVNLGFSFHNLKGETGTSTRITEVSASVDNTVGTPSVDVVEGGTELMRTYQFNFHNLKGEKGNVNYATFEIDPATGLLSMFTDSEYTGVSFAISNGYLEVTI